MNCPICNKKMRSAIVRQGRKFCDHNVGKYGIDIYDDGVVCVGIYNWDQKDDDFLFELKLPCKLTEEYFDMLVMLK